MTLTKLFAPKPQSLEPGTWNLEPGTRRLEPGTRNSAPGTWNSEPKTWNLEPGTWNREAGFTIFTAVFLMVVLALLGAFMLSVTGLQQASSQLDVQGVRAYQAARAGMEWGMHQVLDPTNTLNAGSCAVPAMPACPGATTNLPAGTLADSLSAFTVTVTCTRTTATEGNRDIWSYQLVSNACNQPTGASCPNTGTPAGGYLERQITATLSKCKDATAPAPRCSCD